jgi:hypothetical protein
VTRSREPPGGGVLIDMAKMPSSANLFEKRPFMMKA